MNEQALLKSWLDIQSTIEDIGMIDFFTQCADEEQFKHLVRAQIAYLAKGGQAHANTAA